jgi:hypothetical protein
MVSTYVAAASTSAGELGVLPRKLENNTPASASVFTSGDANMSRRRLAVDASSATVGLSRACAESRDGSRGGSTSAPAGGPVARPIVDGIDATASMAALSLETKNSTRRAFSNGRANAKKMVSDVPIPEENDLQDKKRQN